MGDRPFKRKCMARMQEIREEGRTMLYVSHAAASVRRMCDRVLVLEKGVLGFDGPVDEGIHYLHYDDDDDVTRRPTRTSDDRRGARAPTSEPLTGFALAGKGNYSSVVHGDPMRAAVRCDIWCSCDT